MEKSEKKIQGHVAMLGANVIWGLMSPVAKLVMGLGIVTPLMMTDFRIFGAALLFWVTSIFVPGEKVPPRDLFLMAGAAMMGILFNQGCFIFGVGYTAPGEASIITTTMPLWVMVFAALILKEPITWKKIVGIAMGASGAVILVLSGRGISMSEGDNHMLGDMLVLAAQISYALYLTFYKNFIRKYSLVTLMKWMFTFASIVLLPFSVSGLMAARWSELGLWAVIGAAYVVVFGTYIAYMCIIYGQQHLRPVVVGTYNYVQPIVASATGIVLGLDSFTVLKLLAVALIFSGVYLVVISKSRNS